MQEVVNNFKNIILVKEKDKLCKNIINNWFFILSGIAFFSLNFVLKKEFLCSILVSLILLVLVSSQIENLYAKLKNDTFILKIYSLLTSIGIVLVNRDFPYKRMDVISEKLMNFVPVLTLICSIVGIYFVYVCVTFFIKKIIKIFKDNKLFAEISKLEYIIYGIILLITIIYSAIIFGKTDAFYQTNFAYDVIYTSDSPSLIKENAYILLTHNENDIRQPLFAVFSSPFIGLFALLGKIFANYPQVRALFLNVPQIIMLLIANFILTKTLNLSSRKRICFMVIFSSTYTYLLFTLMMEQYIVAYFYLMIFIYQLCNTKNPDNLIVCASGGTLLISLLLTPLATKFSYKSFKNWFAKMIEYACYFLGILFIFCRLDVIINFKKRTSLLLTFVGKELTFGGKILQYITYVRNCFVTPVASISDIIPGHISWQLREVNSISIIGLVILTLSMISVLLNKKKKSSLLAFFWIVISWIVLIALGWGTKENGLILYSLYFGWTFLALLFQLFEFIEEKLKIKFLIPILTGIIVIFLFTTNIKGIMELLNFAFNNFKLFK